MSDPQWPNSTILSGDPPRLELVESEAFGSGVVLLRYAVTGG